eukprot:Lithocolla_globosa_v1_NODE_6366_length_1097_cov_28.915547.p2 type:complete len:122 gc:universal NODE_6366_length_1097_cov_28.915547:1052-687(-)
MVILGFLHTSTGTRLNSTVWWVWWGLRGATGSVSRHVATAGPGGPTAMRSGESTPALNDWSRRKLTSSALTADCRHTYRVAVSDASTIPSARRGHASFAVKETWKASVCTCNRVSRHDSFL